MSLVSRWIKDALMFKSDFIWLKKKEVSHPCWTETSFFKTEFNLCWLYFLSLRCRCLGSHSWLARAGVKYFFGEMVSR